MPGNVKVELPKTGEETSFYGEWCVGVARDERSPLQMRKVGVTRSSWTER